MDHRAFLSTLPAAQKAALTQRSGWRGIAHLVGHLGLIAVLAIWVGLGFLFWGLALAPLGIALVFLFTLEHECTHKTPFAQAQLNEWVGRACGMVLFLPFEWFRYFHLAHHRWTNIPGKDPELAEPRPRGVWEMVKYLSGIPFWIANIRQLVGAALGAEQADYIPPTSVARIRREAWVMLGLYVAALFFSGPLLWVWIIPILIAQPVLRIYLLAEHGDCPHVVNMFENTRTTFTTGVVRFLAWNMPYHAEHHIYPAVPFHNLPALHGVVRDHLKVTENGYVKFTAEYLKR